MQFKSLFSGLMIASVVSGAIPCAFADGTIKVLVTLSPAGSFVAKSDKLKGTIVRNGNAYSSDKLSVTIDTFKTGIALRDEHFWKYLKHPSVQKITLSDLKAANGKGTGMLEVNGVKKPVEIAFQEAGDQVKATIRTHAHEYGLPPEKYLGISVSDEVNIETQVDYVKK